MANTLNATQSTTLLTDVDGDGVASSGDTLQTQVTITNTSSAPATTATGVSLSEDLANQTLVGGSVTITPIAVDDTGPTLVGNTPITGSIASLLANDLDPDGLQSGLTASIVAGSGTHGTIVDNGDGTYTFTPTTGFAGTATFQYRVTDSQGLLSNEAATVSLSVTDPVWYVDSANAGVQDGSFGHAFTTVGAAVTAAANNTQDAANGEINDTIFVYNEGVTYSQAAGVTLAQGEQLLGDGSALTSVNSHAVGVSTSNASFTVTGNSTDAVTLGSGNTVSGLNISETGTSGRGIVNSGNSGTLHLSNISVSTTGSGISLTGGGTVDATTVGSGTNSITSSAGTALNVSNTTIGASGLTFHDISSSNAASGIILNTTGSSGGLTVTGDGGSTNNHSGGQILGSTGPGVSLNSTSNVSLGYMNIQNGTDDGIHGESVNNFTLNRSIVSNNGNSTSDDGIQFGLESGNTVGLTGTVAITNSQVTGNSHNDVHIRDTSGTISSLTVTGSTFGGFNNSGANAANAFLLEASGTSTITGGTISGSTFQNNTVDRGLEVQTHDTASIGTATGNGGLNITGNTFINNGIQASFTQDGSSNLTFRFENNGTVAAPMTGATLQGINVFSSSQSTGGNIFGTISGNHIGNPAVAGSGSTGGQGIRVLVQGQTDSTLLIDNNNIQSFGGTSGSRGIDAQFLGPTTAGLGTTSFNDITITNNTVGSAPASTFPLAAIYVAADNQGSPAQVRADIHGNTVPATGSYDYPSFDGNGAQIIFNIAAAGATAQLVDTPPASANATAQLSSANTKSGGGAPSVYADAGVTLIAGPINTPPASLLAAPGGIAPDPTPTDNGSNPAGSAPGDSSQPGGPTTTSAASGTISTALTQADLDPLVAQAIANWEATGLTPEQDAYLRSVSFSVSDLGGVTLGSAQSGHVTLDNDAAGRGWYVDSNPADASEFPNAVAATESLTDPSLLPAGHIDLLTTIEHELGHELGLDDTYAPGDSASLMYGYIVDGERRAPAAGQANGATPGNIVGEDFLVAPITASSFTLPAARSVTVTYNTTVTSQTNQLITPATAQGTASATSFTSATTNTTSTTIEHLTLGNLVFLDANRNGVFDAGDSGINGISVSVFADANNNDVIDTPASPLATTTTATVGAQAGSYSFANLAPGNYIVQFALPAAYRSVTTEDAADPDDNTDDNSDGALVSGNVVTRAITLAYNDEPTADPAQANQADINNTLDIGLTQNAAPVVDNTIHPSLTSETEDAPAPTNGSNAGSTLVSSIVDLTPPVGGGPDNVTDADDTVTGLAITGVSGGTLYYSTDDGATWSAVTTPSDTHALLLAADSQTRIYLQPTANLNGTVGAVSFRAWDRTSGAAGNYVNVSTNGSTTAFSSATGTANISITSVNDAPVASGSATLAAINEDDTNPPGATVGSLFSGNFSDTADNQTATGGSSANTLAGIAITANAATAQGTWQYNDNAGSGWLALPGVSDSSAFLLATGASLRFVPALDYNGPAPALTSHLIDNSSGAVTNGGTVDFTATPPGGTTQYSSATVALGETINAVNDAPSLTEPSSYSGVPGAPVTINNITFSDVDDLGGDELATFNVGSGSLTATASPGVTLGGTSTALTATGTLTALNNFISGSHLTFTGTSNTTLTVSINDQGHTGPGAQSFTAPAVNIVLDNPPSTPTDTDTATADAVAENSAANTYVGITAHSTDADSDPIIYSLTNDAGGFFQIGSTSGQISTTAAGAAGIDYDAGPHSYVVTVGANDGQVTTTQDFTINILDVNDNAPVFTSGTTGSEAENSATSNVVYTAVAPDADGTAANNTVTYSLASGGDNDLFSINGTTGAVTFNASPDFEAPADADHNNAYEITVHAIDNNSVHDVTQGVTVSVTDVNDNAPVFAAGANQSVAIDENSPGGTAVATAAATDADATSPNNTVSYSITGGTGLGLFDIDSSGNITVHSGAVLDREAAAGYTLTVQASDGGAPSNSATQQVTVFLSDVNDNAPVFTAGPSQTFAIDENSPSGTAVGTAAATDADATSPNNTVSYSITGGTGLGLFDIDSSGNITVHSGAVLDREAAANYTLTVQASDGGAPSNSATQAVTVNLNDVNDNTPAFTAGASQTFAIDENSAGGTAVGTAAATDADATSPNNTVSYSITGGTGLGLFDIDSSGNVTVHSGAVLDREAAANYTLTVQASDGGAPSNSATQQVTVNLNDVNDNAPVFTSGTTGSEAEGTAASNVVYTASATDADATTPNNTVTYSLASGGDNSLFSINGTTGAVTFNASPNFETPGDADHNNAYEITVHAIDNNGVHDTPQNVTITVTDIAPVGAADSHSVNEDTALNVAAPGVLQNDSDVNGGPITAVLAAGPSHASSFTLNADGSFSYTGAANYSGGDSFTYNVTDGTDTVGPVTVSLTIDPVNDAPVLSGLGDTPAFVENGAPVVLDANSNASVSDAELDASANHYSGATLTLARNGGANPDDVFGSVGSLDLTDVAGNGENVSLDGGATFIGTFTQPGDGSISFTFNANATAADVDSVMRQITYQNTSDNPPSSAQIDFTFSDGNGQPGGQSQGSGATPGTGTGSITVSITQVDDPPQLVSVAPTAAYSPGSAGAVLSPALGVFDPDATPPSPVQGIHSGTVQIASGFLAGDELFVNLTSSGGHFVTPDGAPTNISASYAAGTLTLSGTDTVADYQTVLDAVSYRSTAADPSNGGADPNRTITWSVNDGVLNSQTPAPAVGNNPAVNETVLHFDVAPVVDLDSSSAGTGYTTTYTTSTPPIAIVNNDTITDPDTANADGLAVVLTNAQAGDALSIAGSQPGGISGSIDTSVAGQITVRLTNSASMADYQTALGQIRFANSNPSPNVTDRNITVVLSESEGITSNTAQAIVHVIDATPPVQPPPPDMTDASDSGVSPTDNITNITGPTFTGTAEPGTTVRLYDSNGTTVLGTGAANALTGAYTITSSTLSQGTHHVTVTATDASNNTSVHSTALDVTIDTTPPAPTLTATDATTTFRNSVVHYTLSFPETTFGVDAGDFTLTQSGGAAGAAITGVSEPGGAGTPYTITVSTGTGLGTLQLSLNSSGTGITDIAGNAAGGATGPTYTVANRSPVANIDRVTLGAAQNTLTGNVLSNDSDADGDALRVTSVSDYLNGVQQQVAVPASGTVTLPSTHGVFTIAADGSYSFSANDARPVQNHYAEDPLIYSISDGHGGTANSQLDVNFVGQQRPSTETFNFNFVNSTVTYGGDGQAYLTGPDGVTHNVTGVGLLIFNDGRINESDYTQTTTVGAPPGRIVPAGSALVDDLYYDSQYHDVYLAGVDPEAHYAAFGWHEGRNPDPYFNTNYYLSQNSDVAAAGVNPLTHYDTFGWHEGRNPGPNFNTTDYELTNPDVAAAGVDPLTHYLTFGELENRVIFPANAGSDGPVDGFDPAFYLANNPDVAAAHVNPLQHYLTFGWHEGRNPSADFNTNFYESHNPDVAAAGVDPLIHYDQFGWHEGRDPAAVFSTSGYLTTYTDVAAAGVNPLQHFLQSGMAEGRSPTG